MITAIPNGLDEILATFGDEASPGFEAANIVLFDLPYPLDFGGVTVTRARCHVLAVDNFLKAFNELQAAGLAPTRAADEFSGIFQQRPIRGFPSHPSTHSWGIAIDMDAADYPLGSARRMPDQVVQIWRESGFFYGGDFHARKDPMHFQLATGY